MENDNNNNIIIRDHVLSEDQISEIKKLSDEYEDLINDILDNI